MRQQKTAKPAGPLTAPVAQIRQGTSFLRRHLLRFLQTVAIVDISLNLQQVTSLEADSHPKKQPMGEIVGQKIELFMLRVGLSDFCWYPEIQFA